MCPFRTFAIIAPRTVRIYIRRLSEAQYLCSICCPAEPTALSVLHTYIHTVHTYVHTVRTHVHTCMYVRISIFQHSFADICDSGYLRSSSVKAALDDLEKVLALNSTHILALQSK